jgi:multidrug efflux system outer membrane protein
MHNCIQRNTLVPKLQLGNPVDEAPASRDGNLELPTLNSQAGAWELAHLLIIFVPFVIFVDKLPFFKISSQHWLILALLLELSACTPTRVDDPVSRVAPPKDWHHAPDTRTVSNPADLKEWWKGFQDPKLNDLIDQALAKNHDLRIAVARVREAKAMTTIAESALYPSIDLTASGGREKKIDRVIGVPTHQGLGLFTPTADMITGGLAARWEIDLFGARHLEAEAATAQAEGTEEALHAAQVGLLAQVATNYLELRGVQQRTGILRENINIQRERLRAVQAFNRAGLINQLDVARQETLLHTTESALPVLTATAANLIHRLAVLLGEPPENLESRLADADPLPVKSPSIPRLLPSGLLEQRPDLRLARTEVSAMAASLGAARADLFPKLVLSASGGFGALAVGGFPSLAESVYALGSGLTAPIFNAGRIKAKITAADAGLDQVAANYEKTFLLALEDVENAFVAHAASEERREQMSEAETAAEHAYMLANALYHQGASDYLSVLDAQRSKLAAADERAKAETAVRVSVVSLYRAFGGGWMAEVALQ